MTRGEAGRRGGALLVSGLLLGAVSLSFTSGPNASASAPTPATVAAAPTPTATAAGTAKAAAGKTKAATTPTATTASGALPVTTTGRSQVLAAAQQTAKVGAIFSSNSITSGNHHCTASVVDSPAGDVIVTAAHCLASGGSTGAVFVPGYRDGSAPNGVWQITRVIEDSSWTDDGDQDDDVAFALVAPQSGRSLEASVGGGYTLSTTGTTAATVQLTGYPSQTDEPITCTGTAAAYSGTQLIVDCTAFTGGTSGTAWVADYDAANDSGSVIGVIGGYQQGGDTADTSYSIVFDATAADLYAQALAS
ncbi:trypsin-like serine peptidase [Streptacidiphilus rugosus]|uniref:trypsin-like serine peptidase n=1 Tax=Streptacidiphilus rugosus TaxID=405783 RepID=UPI00068A02FF|nr:hypothetical protein [Streptacidiphilus rugosus]